MFGFRRKKRPPEPHPPRRRRQPRRRHSPMIYVLALIGVAAVLFVLARFLIIPLLVLIS